MPTTYNLAGDAEGVLDVKTGTITGYDAASTYKVTIDGKIVAVLGSGGTATTAAAALVVALEASTYAEFEEYDWTSSSGDIIATANETSPTGKTHAPTLSVSGGTGTITNFSSTTAPDGSEALTASNVKSTAGARALPTNGDTFNFNRLASHLRWSLDALAAVTTLTMNLAASFTGEVGLPFINEDDSANTYNEYRQRYLQTDGGTMLIGAGAGSGSGRIQWDSQTGAATLRILKSATSADDNQYAVVWKGSNASNAVTAMGGSLDVAPWPGETAQIATLTVGGSAQVRTSQGTTIADVVADGGCTLTIDSAASLTDITTLKIHGSARVYLLGDNPVTTTTLDGASPYLYFQCSGNTTFATVNLYAGAVLDLDSCPSTITITTLNVYGACTINDRSGKLLVTNAVNRWSLVTFNGTRGRAYTLGTP